METMTKPNRSDVHVSAEVAAEVEAATRHYFDEAAPKRHTKPQRSEYSSSYDDALSGDNVIPEYLQFQRLEQEENEKLIFKGSKPTEEFSETEYYSDLIRIDKQHHTTGTGFIAADVNKGDYLSLASNLACECHPSCKGNPATIDWIPAAADKVEFITGKPNRSN